MGNGGEEEKNGAEHVRPPRDPRYRFHMHWVKSKEKCRKKSRRLDSGGVEFSQYERCKKVEKNDRNGVEYETAQVITERRNSPDPVIRHPRQIYDGAVIPLLLVFGFIGDYIIDNARSVVGNITLRYHLHIVQDEVTFERGRVESEGNKK